MSVPAAGGCGAATAWRPRAATAAVWSRAWPDRPVWEGDRSFLHPGNVVGLRQTRWRSWRRWAPASGCPPDRHVSLRGRPSRASACPSGSGRSRWRRLFDGLRPVAGEIDPQAGALEQDTATSWLIGLSSTRARAPAVDADQSGSSSGRPGHRRVSGPAPGDGAPTGCCREAGQGHRRHAQHPRRPAPACPGPGVVADRQQDTAGACVKPCRTAWRSTKASASRPLMPASSSTSSKGPLPASAAAAGPCPAWDAHTPPARGRGSMAPRAHPARHPGRPPPAPARQAGRRGPPGPGQAHPGTRSGCPGPGCCRRRPRRPSGAPDGR